MKSLHNTLAESLLDADFDVNVISLDEIVTKALHTNFNKKKWNEFVAAVENSFNPASGSDCAQDYFGTIEMLDFESGYVVRIHFDPGRARGFGAKRKCIEIEYRNTNHSENGCHWLMKPAFEIPDTPTNRKYLNKLYKELGG